jgi:lipopolysaccharide/colanic/teichoic acid biosynthesis glycosyltransferase
MRKRALDVTGAAVALVLLSPLLLLAVLLVLLTLGRPVTFRQRRAGLHGVPFVLVKLRTMRPALAPGGELLDDDLRLGRVGRWLRASSLDELPELWNVLRGDMSLVGPRPLLLDYLPRYSPEQARRHDVRPGLTGLAQVCGRNGLTWEEKFALDVEYVDRHTLRLDLRILARTLLVVVNRNGVYAEGHASAPMFTGAPAERSATPSDRPRSAVPGRPA